MSSSSLSRSQSMLPLLRMLTVCRAALLYVWEPQLSNRLHYSPYSTKLRVQLIRVTRIFWLVTAMLAVVMLLTWALF